MAIKYLKKAYALWLKFGSLLGTINGFIILTVFYFIIIGLYAVPTKLLFKKGKKPTGWNAKSSGDKKIENFLYQF